VQWEYQKIFLNEHHREGDDLDLLLDAGEDGWELVAITLNNIAYLKRAVMRATVDPEQRDSEHPPAIKPQYLNPVTGETWSGRGRMATWLKRKHDAGEDIEKYRV
jgi:hypothetical protein